MTKKYKKILVTGGSGFIGKHLINELLKKKYIVSILDRTPKNVQRNVVVFQGDIQDRNLVAKAMKNIDLVYHLAGVLGTSELNTQSINAVKTNVIGSLNVLEEARINKSKVLLVSKPNVWINTYSITKDASEKFCMMFEKEFGLKAVIVKWFSVYGPGQKHYGVQKAVPTFIVRALKNQPLPIFGSGKQMADFIYTSDTIHATILAAEDEKMEGKIVEIGTGKGTRVIDLAKIIIRESKSRSKLQFLPMRGGEVPETQVVANITLLRKLKFKPLVNFNEGIKETIGFYKNLLENQKV